MKRKITVSILFMTSIMTGYIVLSPLLAEIGKSFPNEIPSKIQMIYNICFLVAIPAMLCAGLLANCFTKKTIALLGMLIMTIGGLFGLVINKHLWTLYICSGILGVGLGIVNVLSVTLVSEYFEGLEKGRIMGFQSATLSISGAIMSLISGKIATYNWRYSYAIFFLFLPIIIIVAILLPKDEINPKANKKDDGFRIHRRLVYFAILGFFCAVFVNALFTSVAMYIDHKGLGDSATSGVASSLFMLIGIPAGMMLGNFIKLFGKHIIGIMVLIIMIGFFITAFASSLWIIYIGSLFIGFGHAVRSPAAITFATNMVPTESVSMSIAVLNSMTSAGNFLSPIIVNWLSAKLGNDISITYIVCGVGMLIIGVVYLMKNPIKQGEIIDSNNVPEPGTQESNT